MRRYSRHLLLPEVGPAGQRKLLSSRVLCVGAGGLGSPVLQYLAAAGVGCIGILDDDVVDITNLQRQVLFSTADIGRLKTDAAAERIAALNPQISIVPMSFRLASENAREVVRAYDVVVDATDTFASRYLINDACRLENKPMVYGSIFRFTGQVSVFSPTGPCYRCLFPEPPPEGSVPTCAEGGVLGVLAGIVGTWQANEVLKLLLGVGTPLVGRLLLIDALTARMREIALARDPRCALCGEEPSITDVCETLAPSRCESAVAEIDACDLDAFLERYPEAVVLDVREAREAASDAPTASVYIPASVLPARLHELDSAKTYVVACRLGSISRWATALLRDAGFTRLLHLRNGLSAYAVKERDEFHAWE